MVLDFQDCRAGLYLFKNWVCIRSVFHQKMGNYKVSMGSF